MIRKQLIKSGLCKKKLNKNAVEILRNIEIITFIDKINIKKYKEIIIINLQDRENLSKFVKYLKDYLFKLNESTYNYEDLIKYKIEEKKDNNFNENNDNIYFKKLYLTNNISESINTKLNYYLPKKATDNKNFVDSLTKVLINNMFNNKDIIRHDYVTRAILLMIKELNLNKNFKWITYNEYIKFQKKNYKR